MEVDCPVCKARGVEDDDLSCTYCGGDGQVSEEARRQYLEFLVKEPIHPESIQSIFKPIKPNER